MLVELKMQEKPCQVLTVYFNESENMASLHQAASNHRLWACVFKKKLPDLYIFYFLCLAWKW